MLADILATRGAYEEAARWCAEVREMLNEDDLTDVIAVDSLEGFLAAAAGSHAEGERLSRQAVDARRDDRHVRVQGACLRVACAHARARRQAASRRARPRPTALAIYEAKGDIPASAWARELLDSLSD